MILLKNATKYNNDFTFDDINITIESGKNYTMLSNLSENCNFLLRVIAGMYKIDSGLHTYCDKDVIGINESFFFIARNPKTNSFNTVQNLIDNYKLYYNNFDFYSLGIELNRSSIDIHDKLSDYSFSKIKLLYLILSLYSGASFIFIESVFDDVNHDIKSIMTDIIKRNSLEKVSFILTSTNVNELKSLVNNVIYDNVGNVSNYSIDVFKKYFKCSAVYRNRHTELDFYRFKPVYMKLQKRNLDIILKRDVPLLSEFIQSYDLLQYDEEELQISDLIYFAGDINE